MQIAGDVRAAGMKAFDSFEKGMRKVQSSMTELRSQADTSKKQGMEDLVSAGVRLAYIIACRDAAGTIEATLKSLAAQDLRGVEVILVDDHSTDNTLEIVRRYSASLPLQILTNPGRGVSSARNHGLRHCDADFIGFLDSDDAHSPDTIARFRKCIAEFRNDPFFVGAYCGIRLIDESFRPLNEVFYGRAKRGAEQLMFGMDFSCVFVPSAGVFRAAAVKAAGGFDESMSLCEDHKLLQEILSLREGNFYRFVEDTHVDYMIRPNGASQTRYREHFDAYLAVLRQVFFRGATMPENSGAHAIFQREVNRRVFNSAALAISKGDLSVARSILGYLDRSGVNEAGALAFLNSIKMHELRTRSQVSEPRRERFDELREVALALLNKAGAALGTPKVTGSLFEVGGVRRLLPSGRKARLLLFLSTHLVALTGGILAARFLFGN